MSGKNILYSSDTNINEKYYNYILTVTVFMKVITKKFQVDNQNIKYLLQYIRKKKKYMS